LLLHFQRDVSLEEQWQHNGTHYQKTARAWLDKMDAHRDEVLSLFASTYAASLSGQERDREALRWLVRWRIFFMCCEELWGYRNGQEWTVSHFLFRKPAPCV
jgi:cyclopropane-fatty-acyl-phospholipid synthase